MDAHCALPPLHPNSNHNRADDDDDGRTSESPKYSSIFMTDDSSEIFGLPVDTSTSMSNNEAERQQVLGATTTLRIGIRSIELPPVLRLIMRHTGRVAIPAL